MKPMGPIPPGFIAAPDGSLAIGGRSAVELAREGTPLFVYDSALIAAKIDRFRAAMPPHVALHYAVKANPYAPLLTWLASKLDGFDLASAGELEKVASLGLPVSFAGPGKRDAELEAALHAGVTINLESEREAARALDIAERLGIAPKFAVRVNPPFALKGAGMRMGGLGTPFGVDADRAPTLVRLLLDSGADWRGLHVYAGSQSLNATAIIDLQRETLMLADRIAAEVGAGPPTVNLGGGFGIPHFAADRPLDLERVGEALGKELESRPKGTEYAVELGRWLVGEAGVYLTRVIDRKASGGRTFLVTDGGLHHMLAASGNFGQLLRRNYPIANATRFDEAPVEEVTVTGCLCTPLDLLGDEVMLPATEVGDLIAIFCAGAYGLTASPQGFLSQPVAREMLV
ncbi:MAG: pyridoxal-dependent decarboxylase, exosortase A system-associated [Sphingomicrobium sp.]|nr:pyridoxal-dependent decarboxylase, exosortase A system-associated [Sphingomonadales bacterium]